MKPSKKNFNHLHRLSQIFLIKNWDYKTKYGDLFEKICTLMSFLNDDEQQLMIDLVEDYLYCPLTKYEGLLENALKHIQEKFKGTDKNIIVLPLVEPKDFEKVKSGKMLLYTLENDLPLYLGIDRGKVTALENPEILTNKYENRKNTILIFVDDFVGSGNTAVKALDYYEKHFKKETDTPLVISLVAQEVGINNIKDMGYEIYVSIERKKGITDSLKINDKPKALMIMDNIEKRLGNIGRFKYGYERSEALVTMIRTPNNTFPIFWWTSKSKGKPWPAPFPR